MNNRKLCFLRLVFLPQAMLIVLFLSFVFLSNAYAFNDESSISLNDASTTMSRLNIEKEQFSLQSEWYFYTEKLEKEENKKLILALDLDFKEGFYTYGPQYSSFPTSFNIADAKYDFYYPRVEEKYDILTNKKLKLYSNNIKYYILFDNISSVTQTNKIELNLSFLLCSAQNCMPIMGTYPLNLPKLDEVQELSEVFYNDIVSHYSSLVFDNINMKNAEVYSLQTAETMNLSKNTLSNDYSFDFAVQTASSSIEATSFVFAVVLGLIAGFILNFMPCVLPVVAIKIHSIMQSANYNEEIQDEMIRSHSLYFSLGILTLFTFLALVFGLFDMMWGAIFQNIYFIIFLASIIFLFALSFFHVFSLPLFNISAPKTSSKRVDSYFQGMLTTLIATPCSGPLLGSTLGFSLTLPLPMLVLVFLSTGLGMAMPYLILVFFPHFIKFIPRSGKWTEIMEKILAFILLLTVLYFVSILPDDLIIPTLAYLLSSAFFLYLYSFIKYNKHAFKWGIFLFILHVALSSYIFAPESAERLNWQEYSYNEFKEELGKTNMIVDFTADWCPTCQVLKETVLTYDKLKVLVDEYDIKLIRVDMTKFDKANQDFLASLDSASIPLLALFRKDIFAYSPIILRDIYTFNQLKEEIENNF